MKKITDERLIVQNLQHIKIAYIVQTIGVLSILGYEVFKGGIEGMTKNPLWMVFMLTSIIYSYLNMSVSVEHERKLKNPVKSLIISLIVVTIIALVFTILTSITPNFNWSNGLLIGGIIFICGVIPVSYVYRLRIKQEKDLEEND
ncbi:hypothetical protein DT250_31265 [Bacillus sp. AR2-1]|uniref:hypothetical protein n=1 Tax=Bacillus cereus group TaxID=86661 RepID=UPI000BF2DDBA|nr:MULTISPECIES: hypothetical protein [Bacillus cereus group]KAA0753652.1 hypothetical protein DT250_31265 [Bacillus sp. AR2-1]PFI81548.1 hypothetical protein COI83_14015 [Bacillus cereus]